jgi:SAM-dependent methyltransferase
MAICCIPATSINDLRLRDLEQKMAAFYLNPPQEYYQLADGAENKFTGDGAPFHRDLIKRVKPGMRVCDLGCGTAKICNEVESRGGFYTGIDWSRQLLENDQKHFPHARFVSASEELHEQFDLVVSLYAIEHVPRPVDFLKKMWQLAQPGGYIGIICPEFVDGRGLPPSFYYGLTPLRFRQKIKSCKIVDAAMHVADVQRVASRWKKEAQNSPPGTFWINLKPRCLVDKSRFTIDTDAIYMARLKDLTHWLKSQGAKILETSTSMKNVNEQILWYNCYVVAQKPMPGAF